MLPSPLPRAPGIKTRTAFPMTLPNPRAFLNALLKTLTAPTPAPIPAATQRQSTNRNSNNEPTNLFHSLPALQRSLLTTLHVLFPPPMLLQALDLLDRRLVTRVVVIEPTTRPSAETVVKAEQKGEWEEEGYSSASFRRTIFQVCSASSPRTQSATRSRMNNSPSCSAAASPYTVHLAAWNCSCAAFAFSALPSSWCDSSIRPWSCADEGRLAQGETQVDAESFGGLSGMDDDAGGTKSLGVPVCKHLLACWLGERWSAVLGRYVVERVVGREEMAGIGGEG